LNIKEYPLYAYKRIKLLRRVAEPIDSLDEESEENNDLSTEKLEECLINLQESIEFNDILSHWICRMIFCRTLVDRTWFLNREVGLFRFKMEKYPFDFLECLKELGICYEIVAISELENKEYFQNIPKERLKTYSKENGDILESLNTVYKIPFEKVSHLICERKVYILKGNAFVSYGCLIFYLMKRFNDQLLRALDEMSSSFVTFSENGFDEITPRIGKINMEMFNTTEFLSQRTSVQSDKIRYHDIENLYKFFPLCMKRNYSTLKATGHLKNKGRQQLGLFLKDIGLSIEDAILFWRMMLASKSSEQEFNQFYAYNILHAYGQVGKQQDYLSYSCINLIDEYPKSHECYGCAFRILDNHEIIKQLRVLDMKTKLLESVIILSKNGQYQQACTEVFKNIFGRKPKKDIIDEPVSYFKEGIINLRM
jgi:DNA primase large subunit